jgi:hypothetical protein
MAAINDVAALAGGGFVAVWNDFRVDDGETEGRAYLEFHDARGQQVGDAVTIADGFVPSRLVAADDGSFVLIGERSETVEDQSGDETTTVSLVAQRYGQEGEALGDEFVIDDEHAGEVQSAALGGGGELHVEWSEGGGPSAEFHRAVVDADGDALVDPEEVGYPRQLAELPDGRVVAVSDADVRVGGVLTQLQTRLEYFTAGGDAAGAPVLVEGLSYQHALVLADGSVALFGLEDADDPQSLAMVRIDEAGEVVGGVHPIDATGVEGTPDYFANQDGGFTLVWPGTFGANYQAFDAEGQPIGDVEEADGWGAGVMMDDGRIALVALDGDDQPEAAIIDIPSTHTPEAGGLVVTVADFQEQDLLTREDGVGTLVTAGSLAMKPFIPNLTMAGTEDMNASGNDMANLMVGNGGKNILVGYLGNDSLLGEDDDDFLASGRGDDTLSGGRGDDIVWGGQGDDSVTGGDGADTLNGDRHDDVIAGGAGDDWINGGAHHDSLEGGSGDDSLTGGRGMDTMDGGLGADTLIGDRDDDLMTGGEGGDSFRFASFFGADTITDFTWAEDDEDSDRIVVEVDEDSTINGVLVENAGDLLDLAEDTDDGVLISIGNGHSILLAGQELSDLGEDMFALVVV